MEMATIGATGIHVSRYCLGAMMFGRFGNPDHGECVNIVHQALDGGINFIDTADVYSAGESEEIVGKALQGRRADVVVATKFFNPMGSDPNQRGGSRRWIVRAVEESLRRLGTDYIDLYQMHRYDEQTDIEETLFALTDLVRQGKIRAFGSSAFSPDRIAESHAVAERRGLLRFRCEQPPYSIFSRGVERFVLPVCARYGMGVITFGPLAGGWLAGRYRKAEDFDENSRAVRFPRYRKKLMGKGEDFDPGAPLVRRKLALVNDLDAMAREAGLSLAHMSMAFVLEHPAVTSAIIGPRTQDHMQDLLACADLRLGTELLDRIDALVPPGSSVNEIDASVPASALAPRTRRRGK